MAVSEIAMAELAFRGMRLALAFIIFGTAAAAGAAEEHDPIRILVMLPQTDPGAYKFPFGAEMCGAAVTTALKRIEEEQILPNRVIKADYVNTRCRAPQGLGVAHDVMKEKNYTAIIGPQCAEVCRHVAKLTAYLNIPTFSGLCQDVEMNDKTIFKTLTRFIGTMPMTALSIVKFLRTFGWNRVSLIAELKQDLIWYHTLLSVDVVLPENNITLASSILYEEAEMDLETVLMDTAAVSRIILLVMPGATFRKALKLALKNGLLNGEYIIINVNYYKQKKKFGDFGWNQGLGDDYEVKEAYKSIIFMNFFVRSTSEEYANFEVTVKNQSAEVYNYIYDADEKVPYPAANLYEATYLLAVALNETIAMGGDIKDGEQVAKQIWGRTFTSLTGSLTLNKNGDRDQDYVFTHMQDYETGVQTSIATYRYGAEVQMLVAAITWPSGTDEIPLDTPICGFQNEICAQEAYESVLRLIQILVGVIASVLLVIGITVGMVVRKLRFEKALADMRWKITFEDLNIESKKAGGSAGSQMSKFSMLSVKTIATGADMTQTYTKTGNFRGLTVAMRHIKHINDPQSYTRDHEFLETMKKIHDLTHQNLTKFVGITMDSPTSTYILTEYCMKGSLQDLLENDDIQLDWAFKCSLVNDIMQGLAYLHTSHAKAHGNLKSTNCVVDGRFVVKLTDFGIPDWYKHPALKPKDKFWTPPECFGPELITYPADAKGDIYSFGIILQEICHREGPFYVSRQDYEPIDVIMRVAERRNPPFFRPDVDHSAYPKEVATMMAACWDEDREERPGLVFITRTMKDTCGLSGKDSMNLMDNLLNRMERYANNLEDLVEERTGKYLEEKKRAEDLLHRLLPPSIADEIQNKGQVAPQTFECVSIYFSDIVHFTALCSESSPLQVVDLLNDLYTLFDSEISHFDVYKVETIGDAYMAVSGLPKRNGDKHVVEICQMALALVSAVKTFKIRHKSDRQLQLRIGIHSGSCVAGVVGLTMPRYCLFGDTVNTASRMESNGEPLKIHISSPTYDLLDTQGGFKTEYRGEIPMKGKGVMKTYWLLEGPPAKNGKTAAESTA